jgi:hypothetical protein
MGEQLRQEISANVFLECSAKENYKIKEVIYESVRASVNGPIEEEAEEESCWDCVASCWPF